MAPVSDCVALVTTGSETEADALPARINVELEDGKFKICGRVDMPNGDLVRLRQLCTEPIFTIDFTLDNTALPVPSQTLDRDCSVGVWTCCARQTESQFTNCGLSNSGEIQVSRINAGEDEELLIGLRVINNFDERLFELDEGNNVQWNISYRLDQLNFIICGKLQERED